MDAPNQSILSRGTLFIQKSISQPMSFRGFISIDLEPTSEVIEFSHSVADCGPRFKVPKPENLHLTLRFLGQTDEKRIDPIITAIDGSIAGVEPFTMELKGAGAFPSVKSPRVVWIGLHNAEELITIASKLNDNLIDAGFSKSKDRFHAHLTIARIKSRKGVKKLVKLLDASSDRTFGTMDVERIVLKKSILTPQGPIYSDVGVVELKKCDD